MADATDTPGAAEAPEPRRGTKGLVFGLIGALAMGVAGFYAVYGGLLGAGGKEPAAERAEPAAAAGIAFIPLEPIVISLPPGSSARYLRFIGQLEAEPAEAAEVERLMPRILDVLNTYLRAVEIRDLEQPSALARLRAQMLRRIQVVTGEGRVRDLLITEFILN